MLGARSEHRTLFPLQSFDRDERQRLIDDCVVGHVFLLDAEVVDVSAACMRRRMIKSPEESRSSATGRGSLS